jgi:hypothetical protein
MGLRAHCLFLWSAGEQQEEALNFNKRSGLRLPVLGFSAVDI